MWQSEQHSNKRRLTTNKSKKRNANINMCSSLGKRRLKAFNSTCHICINCMQNQTEMERWEGKSSRYSISLAYVTICNYAHTLHRKKPFLLEFFRSELDIHTSKRKYMPRESTKHQNDLQIQPKEIGNRSNFLRFDDFNHFDISYLQIIAISVYLKCDQRNSLNVFQIMKKSPTKKWSSVVSIFKKKIFGRQHLMHSFGKS